MFGNVVNSNLFENFELNENPCCSSWAGPKQADHTHRPRPTNPFLVATSPAPPIADHRPRRYWAPGPLARARVMAGPPLLLSTGVRWDWPISSPNFSSTSTCGATEHFSPTPLSSPHESHQNWVSLPPKLLRRCLVHAVVPELVGRGQIVAATTFPTPFMVRTATALQCFNLEPSSPLPPTFSAAGPTLSHGRPPEHHRCLRALPHQPPPPPSHRATAWWASLPHLVAWCPPLDPLKLTKNTAMKLFLRHLVGAASPRWAPVALTLPDASIFPSSSSHRQPSTAGATASHAAARDRSAVTAWVACARSPLGTRRLGRPMALGQAAVFRPARPCGLLWVAGRWPWKAAAMGHNRPNTVLKFSNFVPRLYFQKFISTSTIRINSFKIQKIQNKFCKNPLE
jgi:hypothetical protein